MIRKQENKMASFAEIIAISSISSVITTLTLSYVLWWLSKICIFKISVLASNVEQTVKPFFEKCLQQIVNANTNADGTGSGTGTTGDKVLKGIEFNITTTTERRITQTEPVPAQAPAQKDPSIGIDIIGQSRRITQTEPVPAQAPAQKDLSIGIDTIGQRRRNTNLQLHSEPSAQPDTETCPVVDTHENDYVLTETEPEPEPELEPEQDIETKKDK